MVEGKGRFSFYNRFMSARLLQGQGWQVAANGCVNAFSVVILVLVLGGLGQGVWRLGAREGGGIRGVSFADVVTAGAFVLTRWGGYVLGLAGESDRQEWGAEGDSFFFRRF